MKKVIYPLLISITFIIGAPYAKADVNENESPNEAVIATPCDTVIATPSDITIKNPSTGASNYIIPTLLLISGLGATIKYGRKKYIAKI